MGNKILKKSKGKWIAVSASVLATMALSAQVQAEEATNYDEVVVEAVSEETVVEAVGDTVVNQAEVVEDNDTTVEAVSTVEESEAVQESEPAKETESVVHSETTEANSEQVETTEVPAEATGDETLPAETEEVVTEETTNESVKAEDVQVEKTEESVVRKFNIPTVSPVSPTVKTYQTVSDDTLWKIANQYKVSVANLKDWNKLTSNLIRVNQKLVVSNPSTQPTQPVDKPTTPTKPVEEKPAETTKPVETKPVTKTTNYTIKRGDTLNRIAAQHGVSVAQLRQWNNISGHLIYPNQKIIVNKITTTQPVETTKPEEKPTEPTKPVEEKPAETTKPVETKPVTKTTHYTIKYGDSLYKIAQQYGVSVAQLRQWNNISGSLIHPNQKIIVNKVTTTKPVETTKPEEKPTTPTKPETKPEEKPTTPTKPEEKPTTPTKPETKPEEKPTEPTKPETKPEEKPVETKPVTTTTEYTIKSGDTLNRIARQHGVSVDQLRQWNNISGHVIYPNQKIIVNKVTTNVPVVETKPVEIPIVNDGEKIEFAGTTIARVNYGVQPGDTYESIAKNFGVTAQSIRQLNGNAYLYNGKTIVIPNVKVKPMDFASSHDNKFTVWLDAGHGGSETGTHTVARDVYEKTMNLNIDNKLTKKLQDMGFVVKRTRTADVAVDYKTERSTMANASDADIFISLHHNAMPYPSATGIVSFYYQYEHEYQSKINQKHHNDGSRIANSAYLTKLIHNNMIQADRQFYPNNPARDHGVQSSSYSVIRETKVPSTLLEFGFVDTWNDYNKLSTPAYQDTLVNAMANGIQTYFNTAYNKLSGK
ncbi:LysM peptidoglycan-binding domain-containing protein [Globicatella sulfidifaciens]